MHIENKTAEQILTATRRKNYEKSSICIHCGMRNADDERYGICRRGADFGKS